MTSVWEKKLRVTAPRAAASAISAICVVAVGAIPAAELAEHATPGHTAVSTQRYALAAATTPLDVAATAAFDPIAYINGVITADAAVNENIAAFQNNLPLAIVFAAVDPTTNEYSAVTIIQSTSMSIQELVTAVTAFPGASDSPNVTQLRSAIGDAGNTLSDAAMTVVTTIEPYVRPIAYVYNVYATGTAAYQAVTTLPQALFISVIEGKDPQIAIDNVTETVQTFFDTVQNIPSLPTLTPASTSSLTSRSVQTVSSLSALDIATTEPAGPGTTKSWNSPVSVAKSLPGVTATQTATPDAHAAITNTWDNLVSAAKTLPGFTASNITPPTTVADLETPAVTTKPASAPTLNNADTPAVADTLTTPKAVDAPTANTLVSPGVTVKKPKHAKLSTTNTDAGATSGQDTAATSSSGNDTFPKKPPVTKPSVTNGGIGTGSATAGSDDSAGKHAAKKSSTIPSKRPSSGVSSANTGAGGTSGADGSANSKGTK